MSKVLIAYIPIIHQGYLQFVKKFPDAEKIYLLGEEVLAEFDHLRKDIRRLSPEQIAVSLTALGATQPIEILTLSAISELQKDKFELIMPDEEIMQELAEKYFADNPKNFENVFLRWDKKRSLAEVEIEATHQITQTEFDQNMLALAHELAEQSSDWWRQVGGVIVKDEAIVLEAFNHHVPHQLMPYFDGDPRGNFHKGEHLDKSTAIHAEASLIAQAAQLGISLEGANLYVTTFPCPNCAKLVAYSGIKKLYFQEGYAMVDGQSILKDQGVEIIRVVGENG